MLRRRDSAILAVALVLISGCTSWHRVPAGLQATLPHRERREIWVRDQMATVRGIEVHGDTLRAVPVGRTGGCGGCTVYWLISAIDSVRAPKADAAKTLRAGGVMLLIAGALYGLRRINCPSNKCSE